MSLPLVAEPRPEERAPWRPGRLGGGTWIRADGRADSVQWLDLARPLPLDLEAVERHYFAWVPRLSVGGVQPRWRADGSLVLVGVPLGGLPMIRMAPAELRPDRRRRPILGGFLAHPGGSLDFDLLAAPGGARLVVAVRGLRPRLPLALYLAVQTPLHERSTFAFLREAARRALRAAALRA